MGRKCYNQEQRSERMLMFLDKSREIIESDGIDAISIRGIAQLCRCNSATLYHYFEDLDELLTLSAVGYLKDYVSKWESECRLYPSAQERYIKSWELFCSFSVENSDLVQRMFIFPHHKKLSDSIRLYYELCPEEGNADTVIESISIMSENCPLLEGISHEGLIKRENIRLIGELAVNYFRSLLADNCSGRLENSLLVKKQLEAVSYLLNI